MEIDYLFSTNKAIGSKIISWAAKYEKLGLKEPPSHSAVLLNKTIVIESTALSGVRLIPYTKWLAKNKQIDRIPCPKSRASKSVFEELTKVWGKPYDKKGILFFAYSYLKLILFKKPLPEINGWESKDKYFCTEFVAILSGCSNSMCSPSKMLVSVKSSTKRNKSNPEN
jgi:hypothetical protein